MTPRRLAIVYETPPAAYEYLAAQLLASAGIDRDRALICNLGDPDLVQKLSTYAPHFVLLFDRYGGCLKAFTGEKRGIDNWRGSLFMSTFTGTPVKCLATYHPQRIQLEYGLTGVVRFDCERAARELATDMLEVPQDNIDVDASKDSLVSYLQRIVETGLPVAVDIEGYPHGISCIGFATGPNTAFVVPFIRHDNTSYWSEDDELELWQAVKDVLEAPHVSKIAHNALYELFCLAWAYGIVITGLDHDTMVMHFELYAELPKDLGFCTSIYTKHPYYKSERKATDDRVRLLYNGKDCCRTYECWQAMTPKLMPKQREHYEFNMSLLVPLAYMSLRGIRYDKAAAEKRLAEVQQQIYEKQDEINREASTSRPALAAFYAALGERGVQHEQPAQAQQVSCNGVAGHNLAQFYSAMESLGSLREHDSKTSGKTSDVEAVCGGYLPLVEIFTAAFCRARRTEQREIEETAWQPMRWSKKKWVKAGKRTCEVNLQQVTSDGEPPTCAADEGAVWLRPITKIVVRNVPVALTTFEDVQRFAKDSCASDCREAISLCKLDRGCLTSARTGQLATLLDLHVKINSTSEGGDAQWFLYEHCKLPKQFAKDGNKLTTKLSSDDEAVIKAYLASGKDITSRDKRALLFLKMRKLVTESKTLAADCDPDGRIRCGYNLVGTDTHRLACYESPTGSGYNLQTVTKSHRDLFVADDGCWLCSRDLSGADGFTTAAYSAMLGDSTMQDDYAAKLKPAQIIVLMLADGAGINQLSRDELRPRCKSINEETHWQYFAMKRVQHGSSYGMGKNTMSNQILTDSFKKDGTPIYLSPADCERIQNTCFFVRYPGIKRTHEWMAREIKSKGVLTASNGFSRKFYGRKDDNATVRMALGHLPQVYTTYATTLAIARLWNDSTNRCDDGSLVVEPLHTVHDSLITQWHKEDTEWACAKMKVYFENPILIAGTTLTIPASGSYGPNWKEQSYEL